MNEVLWESDRRERPAPYKILGAIGAEVPSEKNARLCTAGCALPT